LPVYDPSRYADVPTGELLDAAARGFIGVDRRLLQVLMDRGPAAAPDVIAFSKLDEASHRIDLAQPIVDLLRHWNADGALDVYIDIIRRSPEDIGEELIQALLPFREHAIAPLLALYEEVGEEQGSDIAFVLAGLHVLDERVLKLLLERLEYDAADGSFCLGLYGDEAARPALEKMLSEIEAEDVELRREIQFALDQLGQPALNYEPEPFEVLAEYPKTDIPALDLLSDTERIEMLHSPDAETRAAAALTFFNHELSDPARAALLHMAENDTDGKARGRAWAALADVTEDDALRDKLIGVVNDASRDIEERGGAAVGLYGVADHPPATQAIESLYELGGRARVKALEAMWRSLWKPFAKYFAPHLGDADPAIVKQALRGAGYFQLMPQVEKIASYFDRAEPFDDLREDALFAYALAMPGETTRGRMRGMLRKIDELAHLDSDEMELVMFALDERLRLAGLDPVFEEGSEDEPEPVAAPMKAGRNDPCPCGSGQKFKKCHGA
jgi:hypothetical protein